MPCLDRVRWLAGFRIISLEEEMNIAFNDPDTSWYYDVETQNLLYGLQIGADIDLINARRFCLGVTLKGGGYFNQASHDASLRQSGLAFWEVDEDDDGFTYVLEAALGATWCLNDCFALRAEYRVMWIDGLALAPEQTAATRPVAQSMTANGIDTDGGILLHGLYLGAEFRF